MPAFMSGRQEWLQKLIEALPAEIVGAMLTGGAVLAIQFIRERISHARYRETMALTYLGRISSIRAQYVGLHSSGSLDKHLNSLNAGDIVRFHEFMGALARARLDLRDVRQFLVSVRTRHEQDQLIDVLLNLDRMDAALISDDAVVKSRIDAQLSIVLRQVASGDGLDVAWLNTALLEGMHNESISAESSIGNLVEKLRSDIIRLERLSQDAIDSFERKGRKERDFSLLDLLPEGQEKRSLVGLRRTFSEDHPLNGPLRLGLPPGWQVLLGLAPDRRPDN